MSRTKITFTISVWVFCFGISYGATENSDLKRKEPCYNFYQYACSELRTSMDQLTVTSKESQIAKSFLKRQLMERIRGLLEDKGSTVAENRELDEDENGQVGVTELARNTYKACVQDQSSDKGAIKAVLKSNGIDKWPVTGSQTKSCDDVLKKTGLRFLATVSTAPDEAQDTYIPTLSVPHPRFGVSPHIMEKIESQEKVYNSYKHLIIAVLRLFYAVDNSFDLPTSNCPEDNKGSDTDQKEVSENSSKENSPKQKKKKRDDEKNIERIFCDIIHVEKTLAQILVRSRKQSITQIRTLRFWEREFRDKIPFSDSLNKDFTTARSRITENDKVRIHNVQYFRELSVYLQTLSRRKLINFSGWYLAREIADGLGKSIRTKLNEFLEAASKPGIAVNLNSQSCIEKMIGSQGVMDEGVAHIYLPDYFNKTAIDEASAIARIVKASMADLITANTWMDDESRSTMNRWDVATKNHVGANLKLFDANYVKERYEFVHLPKTLSLPEYLSALRYNLFLQKLKLAGKAYDKTQIWPESALTLEGLYSEVYTTVELPAGALQDPVFAVSDTAAHRFGSVGTLAGGVLAEGFTREGGAWEDKLSNYRWTPDTIKKFKELLSCLKARKPRGGTDDGEENRKVPGIDKESGRKKEKIEGQQRFDESDSETKLYMKLEDHMGLRTSYNAFYFVLKECGEKCLEYQEENTRIRNFFMAFAQRYCLSDAKKEDEFRVNYALKTFQAFWNTFGCTGGQPMKGDDICKIMN